jgi:cellulose synthase/poly-beta-1,6-N-acetylglucosamine synthase-like glycosyltransferase
MLNGISLVFWGCVGGFRLVHEHARRVGHGATAMALVTLAAALVGVLLLVFSLNLVIWLAAVIMDLLPLEASTTAGVLAVVVLAGLVLCGVLASHVSARLFDAPPGAGAIVLFGILYWLAAAGLAERALAPGVAHDWRDAFSWALPALTMSACALGVLMARRRAPPAAAAGRAESPAAPGRITAADVAVLVPAHNEEETLGTSLRAVSELVTASNIFVASDGSTDHTVEIGREWGCNVLEILPGRGKARALKAVIEHFRIYERYTAVLILDADSEPDRHYLEHALPLFDDPDVAAVAGHALPTWHPHRRPRLAMFFAAYRMRLYRVTQTLLRYGQTWKHSNVSFIVPGFASMYRCSVLPHIDIDAPGLIIEDFNMTFELHHKRLGKIAYTPRVRCTSHEPVNFGDYVKQVRRWYLGFWQTIRHHGFWPSFFWLSLAAFVVEMLLQSLAFLTLPFLLAGFVLGPGEPMTIWLPQLGLATLTVSDVVIGVFLTDYTITLLTALVERKPILLLYGLGFALLRWIDSFLFLYTLPLAFAEQSDGRWESPKRV